MTKEEMLRLLTAAYTGPGSAAEGTFAGDVLRACADGMAQLWSMEIDGLERALKGVRHSRDALEDLLRGIPVGEYLSGCSRAELSGLFF